jgi:hypothetical protein
MLNWFIKLLSNTVGEWHWPWVDKKFSLKDYFEIENKIRELDVPFVVGLVKTNGHGSNLLIGIAQSFTKDKRKRGSEITHALAHIGVNKGYKHRVVEAIGEGIREVSLLEAIGQRDKVILRVPNPKLLNDQVCKYAIEYLKDLADRDRELNIAYDNEHNYQNDEALDCSETIYHALSYGFEKAGHSNKVIMIERAGKKTWAPIDIRYSDLFIDLYVSGKGFTNGNIY